jgi:hypothetical protein
VMHESSYFYQVSARCPAGLRGRRYDRLETEMAAMRREMHQMTLAMMTGFLTLAAIMIAASL